MIQLVEPYDPQHEVTYGDRQLPASCLVEDDLDGERWLIHTSPQVPRDLWVRANRSGAAAIVTPGDVVTITHDHEGDCLVGTSRHGAAWWWIKASVFEGRATGDEVMTAPDRLWHAADRAPTYREMVEPEVPDMTGFVHLHTHSEMSPLDGVSKIEELVDLAVADGQPGLGLSDHGRNAGHPELVQLCEEAGIRAVPGIEAYLVDDRTLRPSKAPPKPTGKDAKDKDLVAAWEAERARHDERVKQIKSEYYHLCMWAQTTEGLHNIWAMNTEANRTGHHYHPRMDWDLLARHSEGVVASTACLRGPVSYWLQEGDEARARSNLARLQEIFGDRLYVELHANQLDEQKLINEIMVAFAQDFSLPVIAAVDSHYPTIAHRAAHKAWLAAQTNQELQDETTLFSQDEGGDLGYQLMTEAEVRRAIDYLPDGVVDEAVSNTVDIAEACKVELAGEPRRPIFSQVGGHDRDAERLHELCMANWHKIVPTDEHPESEYHDRYETEMDLITRKRFSGYFLQVAEYVRAAKQYSDPDAQVGRRRILVGPGRGSGGGSLVAFLADIIEIDPVDAEIMFERFLTEGREALPDFDIDFPVWARDWIEDHINDRYGEDHTARVGTITRAKNKGIVKDMARVHKQVEPMDYVDQNKIATIIDRAESDSAGLGESWDDLWDLAENELQPYADKYPTIFARCHELVGRVKTYGRHPAGWIVDEESLSGRLPLRRADDQMVTEFDMEVLEDILHFIKFDLLTIRNLDSIEHALELIEDRHGIYLNPYKWRAEYNDPLVWEEISEGHSIGAFQIETYAGTDMVRRLQPTNLSEMADVVTLVRPGPKRSGLTDLYLARRHGQEPVTYPDPRLENSLAPTQACMIYQEQIIAACMELAGYDATEADKVRKILGKKKVELVEKEGQKFIPACVEHGMDEERAQWFWNQMAEFAKYTFGKAHAWSYGMIAYWCAFLKHHFPREFLTACLSTAEKDRFPDFVQEARRYGYRVLPPDVNTSKLGFTIADDLTIRYGLDSIKGVGERGAQGVLAHQPYESWNDFLGRAVEPTGSSVDMGQVATLTSIGVFDSLVPNRRALETWIDERREGLHERCVNKDESVTDAPNDLPCTYDWENEPPPISERTGKPLKRKPVPKKCTKACRNYTPPVVTPPHERGDSLYTDVEIRQRERDMLDIWLSSTPFDAVTDDELAEFRTLDHINRMVEGTWSICVVIKSVRKRYDRTGQAMAFVTVEFPYGQGDLDVAVLSSQWQKYKRDIVEDHLCFARVTCSSRGPKLDWLHQVL